MNVKNSPFGAQRGADHTFGAQTGADVGRGRHGHIILILNDVQHTVPNFNVAHLFYMCAA